MFLQNLTISLLYLDFLVIVDGTEGRFISPCMSCPSQNFSPMASESGSDCSFSVFLFLEFDIYYILSFSLFVFISRN